jgi:hypothetical protein
MYPEMRLSPWPYRRENDVMTTSAKQADIREHTLPLQALHQQFINRHRPVLLRYLDAPELVVATEPDALSYVDTVLTEWHEQFDLSELGDPDARERTFWFALYQLEELAELKGPGIEPYKEILTQDLLHVRELLRHRQPLPEDRFMATRPDGR